MAAKATEYLSKRRSSIPLYDEDQEEYLQELQSKVSKTNPDLRLGWEFDNGGKGIPRVTVSDKRGNTLTTDIQGTNKYNQTGTVFFAGDNSTKSYQVEILPHIKHILDPQAGTLENQLETSSERLAGNLNDSFQAFYGRNMQTDADKTPLDYFSRMTSDSLANVLGGTKELRSALHTGGDTMEGPGEKAKQLVPDFITRDPNAPGGQRASTPLEKQRTEKMVRSLVGTPTPVDSNEPDKIQTSFMDPQTGTRFTTPLTWQEMFRYQKTKGNAYNVGKEGTSAYSSVQRTFVRDSSGNPIVDGNGIPVYSTKFQTATGDGGKTAKSTAVPGGAKIEVFPERPTQVDVFNSETREYESRTVMAPIVPQFPRDQPKQGRNAPLIEALNFNPATFESNTTRPVRSGERSWEIAFPTPIPGGAVVKGSQKKAGVQRYSVRADSEIEGMPKFTLAQVRSGAVSFGINPSNVIGEMHEPSGSSKSIGSVTVGDQESRLSFPVPQGKTNVNDLIMQFPKYVSRNGEQWRAQVDMHDPLFSSNFRELDATDRAVLASALPKGTQIITGGTAEQPTGYLSTSTQTAVNVQGGGEKHAEYSETPVPVSITQRDVYGRGVNIPVESVTGEIKQPAIQFAETNFGSLSTVQQKGVLTRYIEEKRARGEAPQSSTSPMLAVENWYNQASGGAHRNTDRTKPEYNYLMNWRDVSGFLSKQTGVKRNELETGEDIFQTVFNSERDANGKVIRMEANSVRNVDNLKRFELGWENQSIPSYGISQDEYNHQLSQFERTQKANGASDQEVMDRWESTFGFQNVPGTNLYNGMTTLQDENGENLRGWASNSIRLRKPEFRGRGGLAEEAAKSFYQSNPDLSRMMGYDPTTLDNQDDNSKSLLQLSAWAGLRVGSEDLNLAGNMPRVEGDDVFQYDGSNPKMSVISDLLNSYDAQNPDDYQRVTEGIASFMGGGDADKGRGMLINFGKIDASLPSVLTAQKTLSYKDHGEQIGAGAIKWMKAFGEMVNANNTVAGDTVMPEIGRELSKDLLHHVSGIFDAGGDANKERFRREIPYSGSLRYAGLSVLGNNQMWANKETRYNILHSDGKSDKEIRLFEKHLKDSYDYYDPKNPATYNGVPGLAQRNPPQGGKFGVSNMMWTADKFIEDQQRASANAAGLQYTHKDFLRWSESAHNADTVRVGQVFGGEHFGDYDFDPGWYAFLVKNKKNLQGKDELYDLVDSKWEGLRSVDSERIKRIEEGVFNEYSRDAGSINPYLQKISAPLDAMRSMVNTNSPDPAKRTGDIMKAAKHLGISSYDARQFALDSMDVKKVSSMGMGTTYNERRALEYPLEALGHDRESVSESIGMTHMQYQQAIDKVISGNQNEGTKFSTMLSRANIKVNERGIPYYSLSTSTTDSEEGVSSRKLFMDNKGQSLMDTLPWMANVVGAGITNKKDGASYAMMQSAQMAYMFSTTPEMQKGLYQVLDSQNPDYGETMSGRVTGFWMEQINKGKTEEEQNEIRKSLEMTPAYMAAQGVSMAKQSYDENGQIVPGNFGMSPAQAAMLKQMTNNGHSEAAKVAQAAGVAYALKTGNRGIIPVAALAMARNTIGDQIQEQKKKGVDISPGILSTYTELEALGARFASGDAAQLGMGKVTDKEYAYSVIRGMNKNSAVVDTETTGIRKEIINGKIVESNGALTQMGITEPGKVPESFVVKPRMNEADYRKNYDEMASNVKNKDWMEQLVHPDKYNEVFGNAKTFGEIWKGDANTEGFGQKLSRSGAWSSYNIFDKNVLMNELRTEREGAAGGKADYWDEQIKQFSGLDYVDLYHSPQGNTILANVFSEEIKNHNVGKSGDDVVGARLQGIAQALVNPINQESTKDLFNSEGERNTFTDFVQNSIKHGAGPDAQLTSMMAVMASNRVKGADENMDRNIQMMNSARAFGRKGFNAAPPPPPPPAQPPVTPPAPKDPNDISNFFGLNDDEKKTVRSSWLNIDTKKLLAGDKKELALVAMNRASEIIAKKNEFLTGKKDQGLVTKEGVQGNIIHSGAEAGIQASRPNMKFEQNAQFTTKDGITVSATNDMYEDRVDGNGNATKPAWDFKPFYADAQKYVHQMTANIRAHGFTGINLLEYNKNDKNDPNVGLIGIVGKLMNKFLGGDEGRKVTPESNDENDKQISLVHQFMRNNPEIEAQAQEIARQADSGANKVLKTADNSSPRPAPTFTAAINEAAKIIDQGGWKVPGQPVTSNNPAFQAPPMQPAPGVQPTPQQSTPQAGGGYGPLPPSREQIETAQRSMYKINDLLQDAKPFLDTVHVPVGATGNPAILYSKAFMEAVNNLDLSKNTNRTAARAAVEAGKEMKSLVRTRSSVISEAVDEMPLGVYSNIYNSGLRQSLWNPSTAHPTDVALGILSRNAGRSPAETLQANLRRSEFTSFFARDDIAALRKNLSGLTDNATRNVISSIAQNMGTSDHSRALKDLYSNYDQMNKAVSENADFELDPLQKAMSLVMGDDSFNTAMKNPTSTAGGFTDDLKNSFDENKRRKENTVPGSAEYNFHLAAEKHDLAQAKLNTATKQLEIFKNTAHSNSLPGLQDLNYDNQVRKHEEAIAQRTTGVQETRKTLEKAKDTLYMQGEPAFSHFLEATSAPEFNTLLDNFQKSNGSFNDRLKSALSQDTDGSGRAWLEKAFNTYKHIDSTNKLEFKQTDVLSMLRTVDTLKDFGEDIFVKDKEAKPEGIFTASDKFDQYMSAASDARKAMNSFAEGTPERQREVSSQKLALSLAHQARAEQRIADFTKSGYKDANNPTNEEKIRFQTLQDDHAKSLVKVESARDAYHKDNLEVEARQDPHFVDFGKVTSGSKFKAVLDSFQNNTSITDRGERLIQAVNGDAGNIKELRSAYNLYNSSEMSGFREGIDRDNPAIGTMFKQIDSLKKQGVNILGKEAEEKADNSILNPAKQGELAKILNGYSDSIEKLSTVTSDAKTREARATDLQIKGLQAVSKLKEAEFNSDAIKEKVDAAKASGQWAKTDSESLKANTKLLDLQTESNDKLSEAHRGFNSFGRFTSAKPGDATADQVANDARNKQLNEEDATGEKSFGGFARKIFGGFGLMYLRDITGLATQGLGYGMQQAQAMNQDFTTGANQVLGTRNVINNQAQQLANIQALYGTNNDPRIGAQILMGKNPALRAGADTALAGVAGFGATDWLLGALAPAIGLAPEVVAPIAVAAGAVIGGASLLTSVASGAADTSGLAFRASQSKYEMRTLRDKPAEGNSFIAKLGDATRSTIASVPATFNDIWSSAQLGWQAVTDPTASKQTMTEWTTNDVARAALQNGDSMSKYLANNKAKGGSTDPAVAFSAYGKAMQLATQDWASPEAVTSANQFLSQADPKHDLSEAFRNRVISDFQSGANTVATGTLMASGTGRQGAAAYQYGLDFATNAFDTNKPAPTISGNLQNAAVAKLEGASMANSYISGFGAQGGTVDQAITDKVNAFFGKLVSSPFSQQALQANQNAWMANAASGLAPQNYAPPLDMNTNMTPQQAAIWNSQQAASSANANRRLQLGQSMQSESALAGNDPSIGQNLYNYANDPNRNTSTDWMTSRLMQHDPMMFAVTAKNGLNLASQSFDTINGTTLSGNMAAWTDTNQAGDVTGMTWGTSSLNFGNSKPAETAQQIWGTWGNASPLLGKSSNNIMDYKNNPNLNQPLISAMVNGYTDKSGNTYYGTTGGQLQQSAEQWGQQVEQYGYQVQGRQLDYAHTQASWGIQAQQIALGNQQQMYNFGMQQQQMNLSNSQQSWSFGFQQRQLDLGNQQWGENFALNKQTAVVQRGFTQADWSYNNQMRDLNWGWHEEDYAENSRFMTGRQRKLADRQEKRDTITHGLEGDNIDRQKQQQQQLWKLEDQRFALEAKQHAENLKMQQEQLTVSISYWMQNKALQQEQLNKSIEFYKQNFALQQRQIAVDHQYWTDQYNLSVKSTQSAQAYALSLHKANDTMVILNDKTNATAASMNTLTDGAWTKFLSGVVALPGALDNIINRIEQILAMGGVSKNSIQAGVIAGKLAPPPPSSNSPIYTSAIQSPTSYIPLTSDSKTASTGSQTVNLILDGQTVQRWVINTVTGAIA